MEFYYRCLEDYGESVALSQMQNFSGIVLQHSRETMMEAMRLRLKLKKQKLNVSYVDAIGYQISLERGLKFVTGDKEFEKLENVEFVK